VNTFQFTLITNPSSSSSLSSSKQSQEEKIVFNYKQGDEHHIVKRKLKLGRIGGFGKKQKSPKPSNHGSPYPKQPSYNPAYGGHGANQYPKQPPSNPYMHGSNPVGAPPPYPGLGNNRNYPNHGFNQPPPRYPQQQYPQHYPAPPPQYPQSECYAHHTPNMFGGSSNQRGFGNNYNTGFAPKKSKGIGRVGSAGFGALAGTALGAYGGYKLGRMVGNLGRMGHYGYYNDNGRYIKCDPPKNIKVDPETNVSYIPLDDDYDKRCSYFDRPPPAYYEPSMLRSAGQAITNSINFSMCTTMLVLILLQMFWNNRRFSLQ
ncbi:hypothetical protein QR98_0006820, partial [Sarcoptes scabiei]